MWQGLMPDVCVALLTVEALTLAVWPKITEKKWCRITAILLGAIFAAGQIFFVQRDRARTMEEHAGEIRQIFSRFTNLDQVMAALQQNENARQALPVRTDTVTAIKHTLKERTLDLSQEILNFLLQRQIPPGYGQGGFGKEPYGGEPSNTEAYDNETVKTYSRAFQPRVTEIYDYLRQEGLPDEQLDSQLKNPPNMYSIRVIAERLTALAEKLPDTP